MKLIKDGKIFNLDTATLVGTSTVFMHYGNRQRRLYKSVKGTFFETETCNYICAVSGKIAPEYHHPEEQIIKILTLEQARNLYEYIDNGRMYQAGNYEASRYTYNFHVNYEDLFELTEG
jgi:hypothetical protein